MNRLTGIAAMKPAKRLPELKRQLAEIKTETADLAYHISAFETARAWHVRIVGISEPMDANGKTSLIVTRVDTPDELRTVGLHMISSVSYHVEEEN